MIWNGAGEAIQQFLQNGCHLGSCSDEDDDGGVPAGTRTPSLSEGSLNDSSSDGCALEDKEESPSKETPYVELIWDAALETLDQFWKSSVHRAKEDDEKVCKDHPKTTPHQEGTKRGIKKLDCDTKIFEDGAVEICIDENDFDYQMCGEEELELVLREEELVVITNESVTVTERMILNLQNWTVACVVVSLFWYMFCYMFGPQLVLDFRDRPVQLFMWMMLR